MDQIERARSVSGLSVTTDRSYDDIERLRLLTSGAAPDASYDQPPLDVSRYVHSAAPTPGD